VIEIVSIVATVLVVALIIIWVAIEVAWVFISDAKDPRRAPRGFDVKLLGRIPAAKGREDDIQNHRSD
jgi:hypothetical protein